MSSVSSVMDQPNYSRQGRSRHRSETSSIGDYTDYGLPPSGYSQKTSDHGMGLLQHGMRQRQGSVSSLLSNKSGTDLVQGLEQFRVRNQEELARERLEAQVITTNI